MSFLTKFLALFCYILSFLRFSVLILPKLIRKVLLFYSFFLVVYMLALDFFEVVIITFLCKVIN